MGSGIASNPLAYTRSTKGRTLPKKIFVPGKSVLNHLYRRKLHFVPLICEIYRFKHLYDLPREIDRIGKKENTNGAKKLAHTPAIVIIIIFLIYQNFYFTAKTE